MPKKIDPNSYKTITFRIMKSHPAYVELERIYDHENGGWSKAVVTVLHRAYVPHPRGKVSNIDPNYVRELESLLSKFLTFDKHPRHLH